MPQAARSFDHAAHMNQTLSPGNGSPNVNIGGDKAWRAMHAGVGAGIESAVAKMKQLIDAPFLNPVTTPNMLVSVFASVILDAVGVAGRGARNAPGTVVERF